MELVLLFRGLSGSGWDGETEPAELLPEDRLPAGEAEASAGEVQLLQRERSDSQRSARPAAGKTFIRLVYSKENKRTEA